MDAFRYARIPKGLRPEENHVYELLLQVVGHRERHLEAPPKVIAITDIAKDVDDVVAVVLLKELHRLGLIHIDGFVANLYPQKQRGLLGRGALDSMGLNDVPIAIGTEASLKRHEVHSYEFDCSFMAPDTTSLPNGLELLHKLFSAAKQNGDQVTLLLISALQDIDEFTQAYPNDIRDVVDKVVLQGGYKIEGDKVIAATDAANNSMNQPAADRFHEFLSKNKIPSVAYTKIATFATEIPDQLCKDLEATGHPVGIYLRKAQVEMDLAFYATSCNPDPSKRFRPSMDQQWYLKNKSSYFDTPRTKDEPLPVGDEVVKYFNKLVAYDALAALAAGGDDILHHLKISKPSKNGEKPLHQVIGTPKTATEELDPGINGKAMAQAIRALVRGSLLACQQNLS
ncbi:uncharacterized protein BP5553_06728 [Venustampulla echinocandica]|uniref:Inosine/uridine-preferring nucleoside hydrolase domain-containing protein n=1 Tax=Venustampulla echinocandica TaxID=2656787 RepID=A0A370TKQ6_9HELO|nr:uncharacterized protein BP5553_06728 [Venustampulla echinocandica]RDL36116.1 hypothetical protein BP5553_06728 [Venustampulla echinocandica]